MEKINLASGSAVINEDEEFYENLEAPKFVDLTAQDPLRCDDGTWFCVQIGCDQNHEHVDPEDLQKNFILRVMAARSPNVRRTLKQRSNLKCPHSAPAKPPKSRLFKFNTPTEIPDKIQNAKLKNHPISNLKSPSPIKRKIEEKTFTTPKAQNSNSKIPKPKIQNTSGSVFFSAKPNFSVKPKKEQIKEVCAKIRKLNLNNLQGEKRKSVPSRYLAGQVSKKENDSKIENEEKLEINGKKKKSLRPLWKINRTGLKQKEEKSESKKENEEKLETSGKKKKSSRPLCKFNKPELKQNEEKLDSKVKILSKNPKLEKLGLKRKSLRPVRKSVKPVLRQNLDDKKKENLRSEKTKESLKSEKSNEENLKSDERKQKLESEENLKFENVKEQMEKYENREENASRNNLESFEGSNEDKENTLDNIAENNNESFEGSNENKEEENIAENNMENIEGSNENKENVLDNSAKRDETENVHKKQNKKRSLWFKTNENLPPQKVVKVEKKNFQVKTTNPKPFRLRTDERGILKEANMEKRKLNELEPQKEMTLLPLNGQEIKNKSRNVTGTARIKKVVPSKIKCQMKENQTDKIAKKSSKNSLVPKKEKNRAILTRNVRENKIIAKEPRFHALSVPKNCVKRAEISVNQLTRFQ